jgi:hypothetical protein
MSFYRNRVYPHLVGMLRNPTPVHNIRQHLVPLAQGKVLEIRVGPGVNFVHYDPTTVRKVYALEPNPGMPTACRLFANQSTRRPTVMLISISGAATALERIGVYSCR